MKVRVFYNVRPLGWFKIGAITLFPFIFISLPKDHADKTKMLAHEFVHIQQVLKSGWIKFYASYLYLYLRQFLKHGRIDEIILFNGCFNFIQTTIRHHGN
jgi:hypothetical protein